MTRLVREENGNNNENNSWGEKTKNKMRILMRIIYDKKKERESKGNNDDNIAWNKDTKARIKMKSR